MKEVTINWHLTQKCNLKCYYCFAKYSKYEKREIHHSQDDIKLFLDKLYKSFSKEFKNSKIRLNLAGGEPTISKNIDFIIEYAYRLGFKISMISNSFDLKDEFIFNNSKYISVFGLSIDSINKSTNIKIGRSIKDKTLNNISVKKLIESLRAYNSEIEIKINTVVNEFNYNEYLGDLINYINPNKWKVFQALNINSKDIYCSEESFNIFLENHKQIRNVFFESNDLMINSYIMIDPFGRFFQNKSGKYNYSKPIIELEKSEIIDCLDVDLKKYMKRY